METQTKNYLIFLILPLVLLNAAVVAATKQSKPDFLLHASFYDVGKNSAALIKTTAGNKILIDGGSNDAILAKLGADLPFFDRKLDLVVLTNPDSAHVTGLADVLKRFAVKKVLLPQSEAQVSVYDNFLKQVEQKHIEKIYAKVGQRIYLDQSTVFDIYQTMPIAGKVIFGKSEIKIAPDAQNTPGTKLTLDGK